MLLYRTFAVLCLSICAIGSQGRNFDVTDEDLEVEFGSSVISEIIAGHPSPHRPFFVQIHTASRDHRVAACGGAIIHKYFVLTAAHCVYDTGKMFVEIPVTVETLINSPMN